MAATVFWNVKMESMHPSSETSDPFWINRFTTKMEFPFFQPKNSIPFKQNAHYLAYLLHILHILWSFSVRFAGNCSWCNPVFTAKETIDHLPCRWPPRDQTFLISKALKQDKRYSRYPGWNDFGQRVLRTAWRTLKNHSFPLVREWHLRATCMNIGDRICLMELLIETLKVSLGNGKVFNASENAKDSRNGRVSSCTATLQHHWASAWTRSNVYRGHNDAIH